MGERRLQDLRLGMNFFTSTCYDKHKHKAQQIIHDFLAENKCNFTFSF
jgi:hypothetical protein